MMTKQGFSLLEVTLVLGMTALLTGTVFFVYLTCFRTWNAGENRAQLRTELSEALEEITFEISSANSVGPVTDNIVYYAKGTSGYLFYLYSADDLSQSYGKTSYRLLKSPVGSFYGDGVMLATGIHPTVFSFANDTTILTVDLMATQAGATVHMRTCIRPRNMAP